MNSQKLERTFQVRSFTTISEAIMKSVWNVAHGMPGVLSARSKAWLLRSTDAFDRAQQFEALEQACASCQAQLWKRQPFQRPRLTGPRPFVPR